jgi:hypothetical protein
MNAHSGTNEKSLPHPVDRTANWYTGGWLVHAGLGSEGQVLKILKQKLLRGVLTARGLIMLWTIHQLEATGGQGCQSRIQRLVY